MKWLTGRGRAAVTAYIAAAPPAARSMLKTIRAAVKKAAPRALEKLSYGKATLQFPLGTKIPVGLLGRLLRARRRENEEA